MRDDNDSMRTTQITRMNNNRWAVVLGNGYNSANQRPVLLVQYLDGAKVKLLPPVHHRQCRHWQGRGTTAWPRRAWWISTAMTLTDLVYAGDNQGNLWKFDLTSHNPANWAVASGGNRYSPPGPAALSSGHAPLVQPIVAAPTATGQ